MRDNYKRGATARRRRRRSPVPVFFPPWPVVPGPSLRGASVGDTFSRKERGKAEVFTALLGLLAGLSFET